jgi:hypothetical protein
MALTRFVDQMPGRFQEKNPTLTGQNDLGQFLNKLLRRRGPQGLGASRRTGLTPQKFEGFLNDILAERFGFSKSPLIETVQQQPLPPLDAGFADLLRFGVENKDFLKQQQQG